MEPNEGQNPISSWLVWSFIVTSFIGFVDALYLTVKFAQGVPVVCRFSEGCSIVTTSSYATVGPVPVAALGLAYYLALLFMGVSYYSTGNFNMIRYGTYLTVLGLIASGWFVYLQFFVIEAVCVYCMVSAVTSTLLFIFAIIMMRQRSIR